MLSKRALSNTRPNDIKNIMSKGHINSHFSITKRCLTYGDGSVGSDELRQSIANFMNNTAFRPRRPLELNDVTVLAGVSSIIDSLAFCLCEAGEGILLGRPTYVGFISDLVNRAGVKPVLVGFEGQSRLIDPTSLEAVKYYEDALIQSTHNGTPVRALLLCHPHNPFGLCYEPQDFCSNGIRLGAFVSQANPKLHAAMRAISKFAWPSSLADTAWCAILNDASFLTKYFQTLRERLSTAYEHCVALLKQHDIPYVPAHAGPFIWIDLSKHLSSHTLEAERELAWRMIDNKVWLATGEAYRSERPGWFRITFAVDEVELELGIQR
ncbi:1-aminocyclopropane-1-carboxylate synthase [Trichoderma arundinaceum]|uniref:1-aminocyclopropane-1-carboxylate synthase n=1 Tax=Trichoderma arundinaceum TaxID=490622 RepID=A0A395NF45_TRIAR|nr:1-aminocyclopropane-1-carboxylate synthase [Trichoderma arundinaceum]